MRVELNKSDLVSLVRGITPLSMENPLILNNGGYGEDDIWKWGKLNHLSEEELVEIFRVCKSSWL